MRACLHGYGQAGLSSTSSSGEPLPTGSRTTCRLRGRPTPSAPTAPDAGGSLRLRAALGGHSRTLAQLAVPGTATPGVRVLPDGRDVYVTGAEAVRRAAREADPLSVG